MNILFVAEYCFANPDFTRLSKELAKRGHDVAIATSLRPTDSVPKDQSKNMFQIQPFITLYSIPHTLSFPFSKIYRIVKEKRIQVIHALNDHSTNVAIAALVSRITGVPFVYTIQGPGTRTGNWLVDTIVKIYDLTAERWNAKQAKRVILLSKSLDSTAKKLRVKESKVTIIPSGMDQERFDSKRSDIACEVSRIEQRLNVKGQFVAGFVGRLVSAKGLTYLFSAAKELQKNHSNVVVLIVGDGPQRTELETMAADLGINVVFAGWQSDPRPFYSIMDVFVLPSFFEGLPNVVLEAMAMNKPVVATKVGGNLDVIANGENGFLVGIRDSHQLASALATLIENEDVRHRMGMANREKIVTLFQWSRAVEEIEKVYNEISKADLASSVTGQ